MDAETERTDTELPESSEPDTELPESSTPDAADEPADELAESFPRSYVEKLRDKNHNYRTRARDAEQRAEQLARELFTARVERLGRLADPSDLPYDAELLDDPDALGEAVSELLTARPHLAARRAAGNIGQHEHGGSGDTFSLVEYLRPQ